MLEDNLLINMLLKRGSLFSLQALSQESVQSFSSGGFKSSPESASVKSK